MLSKAFDTLRYLWQTSPFYRLTLMGRSPKQLAVIPTDPWPGDMKLGRLLLDGKFLIADQIILISDLWMSQKACVDVLGDLHCFTWLRDLRALGDNSSRRLARQLIANWIDQNQNWMLFPWKVDITGHRVANWIALYDFFCSSADDRFRSLYFSAIARQVRHLTYSWKAAPTPLERLCALKGLIYAAVVFPKERDQLNALLPQLERELQAQILADGGHSSRDPQTHLSVLRDLIDIRSILRLIHLEIPSFLQTTINQMAPIVRFFRHGDGELSNFGKASRISSSVIDMVLSLSDVRGRPPERASILGFERCVNKKSLILLNVGKKTEEIYPNGVEEGTGSLNFEWSVGRDRLVVQGDLILQTCGGDAFQVSNSCTPESLQLHRTSQGGHSLLDVTYEQSDGMPFRHRRQLYLAENQTDLRGEDSIWVSCEGVYGVRFILAADITAFPISGRRGVLIGAPHDRKQGRQWRFLASGAEEILCEPYAKNQAILLLGRIPSGQSICIQWAFQQD